MDAKRKHCQIRLNNSSEDTPVNKNVKKQKKRSLVERELETNLTARVTSPVNQTDGNTSGTSRYGRARKSKSDMSFSDYTKVVKKLSISPVRMVQKSPTKPASPVNRMHASNSTLTVGNKLDNVVISPSKNNTGNITNENTSIIQSSIDAVEAPIKKSNVFNLFNQGDIDKKMSVNETNNDSNLKPSKSASTCLNMNVARTSVRSSLPNQHDSYSSVVKILDFDSGNGKKERSKSESGQNKEDVSELEAHLAYQVGDIAWARIGSYPFWPCIISRDPFSGSFVKKKALGRAEKLTIHVIFFGDKGRRGWVPENMLRPFLGLKEFETTREQFSPEAKKKDPKLYAAFFVSEKSYPKWNISLGEADMLYKEPKSSRIDLLNEMLLKSIGPKTTPKKDFSVKLSKNDGDVTLSESLYDTLFSEDDCKIDDVDGNKNKSSKKSLDVSEVVTACLDNMAAKTGMTNIQKQSHMDKWLQKAKSKTPEKVFTKLVTKSKIKKKPGKKNKRNNIQMNIQHYLEKKSSKMSSTSSSDVETLDNLPAAYTKMNGCQIDEKSVQNSLSDCTIEPNTESDCDTYTTNSNTINGLDETDAEVDVCIDSVKNNVVNIDVKDIENAKLNLDKCIFNAPFTDDDKKELHSKDVDDTYKSNDNMENIEVFQESASDENNYPENFTETEMNLVNDNVKKTKYIVNNEDFVENKCVFNGIGNHDKISSHLILENTDCSTDIVKKSGILSSLISKKPPIDQIYCSNNTVHDNVKYINVCDKNNLTDQEYINDKIIICGNANDEQEKFSNESDVNNICQKSNEVTFEPKISAQNTIYPSNGITNSCSNLDEYVNNEENVNKLNIKHESKNKDGNKNLDYKSTHEFEDREHEITDYESKLANKQTKFVEKSNDNNKQNDGSNGQYIDDNLDSSSSSKHENNSEDVDNTEEIASNINIIEVSDAKYVKDISRDYADPVFLEYVEKEQDILIHQNPTISQEDLLSHLYKTWLYMKSQQTEEIKNEDMNHSILVKDFEREAVSVQPKRARKKVKLEKDSDADEYVFPKEKLPRQKNGKPIYNESDISDSDSDILEASSTQTETKLQLKENVSNERKDTQEVKVEFNEVEYFLSQLIVLKPNVFKGLLREKVCEICENVSNLVKCKGPCAGMFHIDCVNKQTFLIEHPASKGRRKKKPKGRKSKSMSEQNDSKLNITDSESHSDEKSYESNMLLNDRSTIIADVDEFEASMTLKMKEMLENDDHVLDDTQYSTDDELDWNNCVAGKCEIVDFKLKPKVEHVDNVYSDFKCNSCKKYEIPLCYVCKSDVSPKNKMDIRQRCNVAHCHKYYHLECLVHWPQTQYNSGDCSKSKKNVGAFEAITCPRHVCHTCVSDDPRGCKTRFSGDKLAKCVRCPAVYHSFTKCLPAGTQILTGSHIICPRHYEHRPGKVPCHVNTGWCFICALGGTLICCEYCPTSFHAECLKIKPPEGGYMCEDCETGRLPLYGEMVWVKLGHYRWWPGLILHPLEIPENIMAVRHSPGEFVVRFFGQYDYYWVNRGRVFPFQEGDSGKVSSQKSKIDAAFSRAMEDAQRACLIMKELRANEEESTDIASSLLPPHYIKLKVNKPCGSLVNWKLDANEANSLTLCECYPEDEDPCGMESQCLNRMLLTECGPTCRSGDRCNNRSFEKRRYPKMTPYRTPHRGWGLKTLEDIKKGQFVIEYVGELIDETEFQRRMGRMHEMRDENYYFLTLDKDRMIDAGPKGNLSRFMNHCCEPNCETQKWTVLGDVRVGLFAIDDIPANTEVTFNYNLESAGIDKKQCMCGAKRCSGYIGAKPKQDETLPKKPKMISKKVVSRKRKTISVESTSGSQTPVKPKPRSRVKPRELTEIEKDLLIIKNATNGMSSDAESDGLTSTEKDGKENSIQDAKTNKPVKRKQVSFSTEEDLHNDGDCPPTKKAKISDTLSNGLSDFKVKEGVL